jgi:N-acetylmuramoyl-L-alanine amidase
MLLVTGERVPGLKGLNLARLLLSLLALILFAAPVSAQTLIVIDPGHGGNDPGGTGTGLRKKDVVLDTSKRFRALLNADTADDAGGGSSTIVGRIPR